MSPTILSALDWVWRVLSAEMEQRFGIQIDYDDPRPEAWLAIGACHGVPDEQLIEWIQTSRPGKQWSLYEWKANCIEYEIAAEARLRKLYPERPWYRPCPRHCGNIVQRDAEDKHWDCPHCGKVDEIKLPQTVELVLEKALPAPKPIRAIHAVPASRERHGLKPENVFNPGDIERLQPKAHVMPPDLPSPTAESTQLAPRGVGDSVLAIIRTIATAIETERQNVEKPRLWLTLEEAAEVSGLRKSYILDRARAGIIDSVRGGPHGALRIRRASLETF